MSGVGDVGDVRSEPETIDGPWMTEVLAAAGVARGATVTGVELVEFVGTGQVGRNARLRLTWDEPSGRPSSVVGKFASDDPPARANAFESGTYRNEWEFYTQLAPTLRVRTPLCYAARFDEAAPAFVLIMEDLHSSRQGDQFEGLSVDEAALAVEQAVGLHAPRWGDPTLASFAAHRPRADEGALHLGTIYQMMIEPFLARLGPGLDADVIQLVHDLGPHAVTWAMSTDTPRTAVHLDFRPDNFMFGTTPGAPPLVVVDWQTVNPLGNAMWDLAYMIGGSYAPDGRARVERALLDDYRARMATAGVSYDAQVCWRDYRLGALWGVVMSVIATVLAAQTERGDAMLTVMAQRHGRHSLDLDALALLG